MFRLVAFVFNTVKELVDRLDLKLGLLVSLAGRGVVDGLGDDALEVRVDTALVHPHKLAVEHVFSLSEDLLGLTTARLLSFALSPVILSQPDHRCDVAFLLEPHELLRKLIHSLADDAGLERLSHTVLNPFLVSFNKLLLLRHVGLRLPLFSKPQFSNEVESFLFAFKHHVLHSPAPNEPLQQDDGSPFLILFHQVD